jgi:acyl carrier protein
MPVSADDILDVVAQEALIDKAKLLPAETLESLGIASLDVINIVFALEDRFGVVLEQTEFEGVHTVDDLVKLVQAKAAV